MKKEIKINEYQFINLDKNELEMISGGGFWTYVTGIVVAIGVAIAVSSENMRAADRASGYPLANKS
jgi:lactobin A/cerein 7B family class IIb bacteriocin